MKNKKKVRTCGNCVYLIKKGRKTIIIIEFIDV